MNRRLRAAVFVSAKLFDAIRPSNGDGAGAPNDRPIVERLGRSLSLPVNQRRLRRDQGSSAARHPLQPSRLGGPQVKSIRPNNSDPIAAAPPAAHNMGKIIIRFVVLLAAAILVMAFAWTR